MIYIITGQTATGKTAHALELAAKFNGEIVNADARQIYTFLDIITGKDLDKTTGKFTIWNEYSDYNIGFYKTKDNSRIWLYDILQPSQMFSAFEYGKLAKKVINHIQERGKTPIIVGGTFFYIHQLLYGGSEFAVEPDLRLRRDLSQKTVPELQHILKKKNVQLFNSLNNSEKNNPQRLIRKIEIETHSSPNAILRQPQLINNEYRIIGFAFQSKDDLRETITQRVERRLAHGAIQEVQELIKRGFSNKDPGMKTIGYQQIMDHLSGKLTWDQMKQVWITREIQYAKRQLTLMKKDQHIQWNMI